MKELWGMFGEEPFLTNPHLFVNPRKERKVKKMAIRKRNSKGRFVKNVRRARAVSAPRRRSHSRRRGSKRAVRVTGVKSAVLYNPRRKRHYRKNSPGRRRHYRRNPVSLAGIFSMGTLKLAGLTGAGFLGTPLIAGFIMGYIPITDPTTRKWVNYGVDGVAAWGLSFGTEKVLGREAGRAVLIGGLAYVAVSLMRDFLPGILPGTAPATLSAYPGRNFPGMRSQPLLGKYSGMGSSVTQRTADRLNPANRF